LRERTAHHLLLESVRNTTLGDAVGTFLHCVIHASARLIADDGDAVLFLLGEVGGRIFGHRMEDEVAATLAAAADVFVRPKCEVEQRRWFAMWARSLFRDAGTAHATTTTTSTRMGALFTASAARTSCIVDPTRSFHLKPQAAPPGRA